VENLLCGNRRLLEQTRERSPARILHDCSREVKSAEIGKDQRVLEERRSLLQRWRAAQIADQHARVEVRHILQRAPGPEHQVINHGGHGAALEHGVARQLGILVGPRCFYPRLDLEMLVLERMRQFMRHHHPLVGKRAPVSNIEFMRRRIVKPLDLFREHIDHERIEVESLREEAKGFGAALVGVAFGGILVFVHLLDDVGADFLARTQGSLQRCAQFQPSDLAHLAEDFIGGSNELGIRGRLGMRGRWSDGRFLCLDGDITKEKREAQKKSAQPEKSAFQARGHIVFRIAESTMESRTTAGTLCRVCTRQMNRESRNGCARIQFFFLVSWKSMGMSWSSWRQVQVSVR